MSRVKGLIESSGLRLTKNDRSYVSKGPLALRTVGSKLYLDKVAFKTKDKEHLKLSGSINSRNVDMHASGLLNADLFQPYIPKVEDLAGDFGFKLGFTGFSSKPRITGKGNMENGQLKLRFFPAPFENVSGAFAFKGKEIALREVTARCQGAPFTLFGNLQHRGVSPSFYDIGINYNNWEGDYPSWLHSKSDGRLRVVGVASLPTLTGEIVVQTARYEDNIEGDEFLPEFKTSLKKIQSYQHLFSPRI